MIGAPDFVGADVPQFSFDGIGRPLAALVEQGRQARDQQGERVPYLDGDSSQIAERDWDYRPGGG